MMHIRKMIQSDVAAVTALEKLCFSDPWSEASISSELTNPLSLWLIAEEAGVVAGYVGSQTVIDQTDMMNIAVHPDFRRKGIARALIEALVPMLRECGSESLTLEVRASNDPAIALYLAMGFSQVGRRPNYYRNPKEDALILRKEWYV